MSAGESLLHRALAVYSRDGSTGLWHGSGLLVITPRGSQVCALTRFESHTLRAFGMPSVLAGGDGQLG
jgi:RNA polymerase sigma-70 factor, ECF subfamily